jgi:hypothetical protein
VFALLRLFRALILPAMLWVSKLILDAVVGWISRRSGTLSGIGKLVALELALATVAGHTASRRSRSSGQAQAGIRNCSPNGKRLVFRVDIF